MITGRVLALGSCVAASMASAPAFAQPAQSPGEWQYNQTAESCLAFRRFDTADGRVALRLRSFGPGSAIEAMVVSSLLPDEPASIRFVELGWDGEGTHGNQVGLLGSVGGVPSMTVLVSHRPVAAFGFTDESGIMVSPLDPSHESMQLRVVGDAPIELRMGSLEEPLRRLMECEAALMEKWGWGTDYSRRVASAPTALDPQMWFYSAITYPAVELLRRVSSILQVRMKVDVRGRVTDCVVQSSPGSTEFGAKNCDRLVRLARYTPGRDPQGQPVESYAQMSITFAVFD